MSVATSTRRGPDFRRASTEASTSAIAVRPTGRREFEIGLEDRYVDDAGPWLPRARSASMFPTSAACAATSCCPTRRSPGSSTTAQPQGSRSVGARRLPRAGGIFGSGVGGATGRVLHGLSISGSRSPGLPEGAYALKIRIEDTPGPRGTRAPASVLASRARSGTQSGRARMLKAEPADSLAHAEELGDAIRLIRANGKKVVCHLEDARGRALYVCSQADRIVMHPAGGIRFAGLRTQYQYYGRSSTSSASTPSSSASARTSPRPRQFTRDGASDVARADHLDMLHEYEDVFLSDVGGGRRISDRRVGQHLRARPVRRRRSASKRIWSTAQPSTIELEKVVEETVGHHVSLHDEPVRPKSRSASARRGAWRCVYVEGDMVDGKSRDIPLIGTRLVGSYTIAKALKEAREDPQIGAVLLRVESPGGSSLAADVMWREIVADQEGETGRRLDGLLRRERRLLHRQRRQHDLRQPAHRHRQHRDLLWQSGCERADEEDRCQPPKRTKPRRVPTASRYTALTQPTNCANCS